MAQKRKRNFAQPALESFLEDIENDADIMSKEYDDEQEKEMDNLEGIDASEPEDEMEYDDEGGEDVIDAPIEDPVDGEAEDDTVEEGEDLSALFPTKERVAKAVGAIAAAVNSEDAPEALNSVIEKRKMTAALLASMSEHLGIGFEKVGPLQQIITDVVDNKFDIGNYESDDNSAAEPETDDAPAPEVDDAPVEVSDDDKKDFEDVDKEIE